MSRILAIDYGDVKTGVAITDPLNITAQGLETIFCEGSDKVILKRVAQLVEEYDIDTIVLGNPINMSGKETERTIKTDKFYHKLKSRFNTIEIVKVDERLSTVSAEKTMNFLNIKQNKKREIVDTLAATYILETYINMKNNQEDNK